MGYFDTEERKQKLLEEMESWKGTPWRHRCGVKQAGTDCVHFALSVYHEVGAIKFVSSTIPKYNRAFMHTGEDERLYNEFKIRRKKYFEEISLKEVVTGDLILFKFGKITSHCGILHNDSVYQAVNIFGVIKVYSNDDNWNRRKRYAFRVVDNG